MSEEAVITPPEEADVEMSPQEAAAVITDTAKAIGMPAEEAQVIAGNVTAALTEEKKKRGRKAKEKAEKNSPVAILAEIMGGEKSGDEEKGISVIYGQDTGDEIIDSKYFISTGLEPLDIILGHGGLGTGKVSEIFGDKSSGKSELAQLIASNFLNTFKDGVVAYFDQERSIESGKLDDRPIFKSSRFAYCWSPTAEKLFTKLEKMLIRIRESKAEIPSLIIVDSVAALLTDAEADKELYEKAIASLASTLSAIFKRINPWLPKINCHLMFLNQTRANFGGGWGGADEDETPGGKALKFYADYRIHVKKIGRYWIAESAKKKSGETDQRPPDGQLVQLETVKNKIAPPYRKVVIPLLYNDVQGEKGLTNVWGIWYLLKRAKYINSAGKGYYDIKTEPIPDVKDDKGKAVGERTKFTLKTWKEALDGPMRKYIDIALKQWEYWAMSKTTLTEETDDDADETEEESGGE